MMEEEEEGQYDDITKYEDASSEDEHNVLVTEEPKSDKGQKDCITEEPKEEKTEFAKAHVNGYESMSKTESENAKKEEEEAAPAGEIKGSNDQDNAVPDKTE